MPNRPFVTLTFLHVISHLSIKMFTQIYCVCACLSFFSAVNKKYRISTRLKCNIYNVRISNVYMYSYVKHTRIASILLYMYVVLQKKECKLLYVHLYLPSFLKQFKFIQRHTIFYGSDLYKCYVFLFLTQNARCADQISLI